MVLFFLNWRKGEDGSKTGEKEGRKGIKEAERGELTPTD